MQITIQRKKYLAWELSRHTTLDNLVYNQSNTCNPWLRCHFNSWHIPISLNISATMPLPPLTYHNGVHRCHVSHTTW